MTPDQLPRWLADSYRVFHDRLTDEAYPCFFGTQAERRRELYYSFVDGNRDDLPGTLSTFITLADRHAQSRHNLAVFFKPRPASHQEHRQELWDTLQFLHDADPEASAQQIADPSDYRWEFTFRGTSFFVVGLSPSYERHRSRNMGPGLVLLFQPRRVFIDARTGAPIDQRHRDVVRERLRRWDGIEPHPDLGAYSDPANLEWRQYFLSDDSMPERGRCPFRSRAGGRRSE
jgi:uncharacterized protein